MKRVLVASILGLAASVASSYGQAAYFFDTYLALVPSAQYGVGGAGEVFLNSVLDNGTHNLVANLLYSTTSGTAQSGTANASPVAVNAYGAIQTGEVDFDNGYANNTPINFTIQVWSTATGATYAAATTKGSISWTDPGMVTGAGGVYFAAGPLAAQGGIMVTSIPEPTTMALAGLGLAGLMIFRKRA